MPEARKPEQNRLTALYPHVLMIHVAPTSSENAITTVDGQQRIKREALSAVAGRIETIIAVWGEAFFERTVILYGADDEARGFVVDDGGSVPIDEGRHKAGIVLPTYLFEAGPLKRGARPLVGSVEEPFQTALLAHFCKLERLVAGARDVLPWDPGDHGSQNEGAIGHGDDPNRDRWNAEVVLTRRLHQYDGSLKTRSDESEDDILKARFRTAKENGSAALAAVYGEGDPRTVGYNLRREGQKLAHDAKKRAIARSIIKIPEIGMLLDQLDILAALAHAANEVRRAQFSIRRTTAETHGIGGPLSDYVGTLAHPVADARTIILRAEQIVKAISRKTDEGGNDQIHETLLSLAHDYEIEAI